jgi:hypothetical protein
VGFAGQRGQGGGDLGERGSDVRRRGGVARAVGVAGVGVAMANPQLPEMILSLFRGAAFPADYFCGLSRGFWRRESFS